MSDWSMQSPAAQRDERYAFELLRGRRDIFDQAVAESYFRSAARYWRLALRFDEATRVENRVNALQQHSSADFGFVPDRAAQSAATPSAVPRALAVAPVSDTRGDIFDQIERADAEHNDAIRRGDLAAMKRAESQLRALGINPTERK